MRHRPAPVCVADCVVLRSPAGPYQPLVSCGRLVLLVCFTTKFVPSSLSSLPTMVVTKTLSVTWADSKEERDSGAPMRVGWAVCEVKHVVQPPG